MTIQLVQLVQDTFTRANAATLGSNWLTSIIANAGLQISGNQAVPQAIGTNCTDNWIAPPKQGWSPNQYAQATLAAHANNNVRGGPAVRLTPISIGLGGYCAGFFLGSATLTLFKVPFVVGGSYTSLATFGTANVNDVIGLAVQDIGGFPTLTVIQNGVALAPFTDNTANPILFGSPGAWLTATTAVTDVGLTNWSAGMPQTPPTILGTSLMPVPLSPGTPFTFPVLLTSAQQSVQFTLPPVAGRRMTRLQITVGPGNNSSVTNPKWFLNGSQDYINNATPSWFPIAMENLQGAPLGAFIAPSVYASWADIDGLPGSLFQFGLASGTVSGTGLPINITIA